MTGGYITGTSTTGTFDAIKTATVPKTAAPITVTGFNNMFQVQAGGTDLSNGVGGSNNYQDFKAWLAFDCTDIADAPSAATLHLSIKSGATFTNIGLDHEIAVVAPQTASGKMGFPDAFFDSSGATNQTAVGTIRPANDDIEGFGNGDVSSAVTRYADVKAIATLASVSDGHDFSIALNPTAMAAMASQDIFVICIVDNGFTIEGLDPVAGGNNSTMQINFSDGTSLTGDFFAPFIEYVAADTGPYTNKENESAAVVGGDFTINTFSSAVLGAQFAQAGEQVPFSLGTPGVRHLRGRLTAYATEKGETAAAEGDKRERDKKKKER